MNRLVSDLRDYAKPIESAFGDVDLKELMGNMMPAIKSPETWPSPWPSSTGP